MPPVIEQTTYASVAKEQSRSVTAIFDRPTKPGSLIVAVDSTAGTIPSRVEITGGAPTNAFTKIASPALRDVAMDIWYRQNSPSMQYLKVTALDDDKSHQLRLFEISGMAQANVLDKISIRSGENRDPYTGSTGNTSQSDELVMGFITNQYASTSQYGFKGNLTRLYESVSPQKWWGWWGGYNQDWERSRQSVHIAFPQQIQSFSLECDLSTTRRWMAAVVTFRTGTSGPARMSATQAPEGTTTGTAKAGLTAFGPLRAGVLTAVEDVPPMTETGTQMARMGLFNYQYRLGGWTGLLIGSGTRFLVEGTEGLGGFEMRTSDDELPRGDGSLRGIDLMASRQILFNMNVGKGREEVERNMAEIYRALVPQRDTDWELMFRFPTLPMQMIRVRPITNLRRRDGSQITWAEQKFALQAVDPRIYSAVPRQIEIPVSPAIGEPERAQVINIGNYPAYPKITIIGPPASYGQNVTRIQLVNETALVNFEAELQLLPGTTLTADMDARIRGSAVSPVTLDGQSKYGAWQLPREPFRIDPDPTGFGGYNEIYLRTEPAGAPIKCILEYRDTWAS